MDKEKKTKKGNKLLMQILSVFVAISLWIIVGYAEDPIIDVPITGIDIQYIGQDTLKKNKLTISEKSKKEEMSVIVSGNRSVLMHILGKVSATVDVSQITEAGTYNFAVNVNVPSTSVQIVKQKMTSIDAEIENIITKSVPVRIKQAGNEKNKDIIVESIPDNENISIGGAESIISQISYASVIIDVSEMKTNSTQKYNYMLMDNNDSVIDQFDLTVDKLDLFVTNNVYKAKQIPVVINFSEAVKSQYAITIKSPINPVITVGIVGNEDIQNLYAEFEDREYQLGINEYILNITDDDNIYIPEDEKTLRVKAEFVAKQKQSLTIPIKIINIPDGKRATLLKSNIDIQVNGVVGTLNNESVLATVDVSRLSDGVHIVNIDMKTDDNVTVIGNYTADVTIQ